MHLKWSTRYIFIAIFMLIAIANVSAARSIVEPSIPYTTQELLQIKQYLLNNITNETHKVIKEDDEHIIHSIPGAVLASPTNKGKNGFTQDYQFHWVRDAALAMNELSFIYKHASPVDKKRLKPYLLNYIQFERTAQNQISKVGEKTLGQPKFNLDATVWEGEWTRPQNDGPALRAITLTLIANSFLEEGDEKFVRDVMTKMIKTDLDYVAMEWQTFNYDLWEEVGDTDLFYTKMVQRKSLIKGAALLKQLHDEQRIPYYLTISNQITDSLNKHWNAARGYFTETIHQQFFKGGGINTSIILGVLHGDLNNHEDPFSADNDRIMSTVYYTRNAFSHLYRINIDNKSRPTMMGRYPNDVYNGHGNEYGNPWFLTTNALAQYYYALANVYLKSRSIAVTKNNILFFQQIDPKLVKKEELIIAKDNPERFDDIIYHLLKEGDQVLMNAKQYGKCDLSAYCLHFAEQIDRTSGAQIGAKDLTWNYTSILTAMQTRDELMSRYAIVM